MKIATKIMSVAVIAVFVIGVSLSSFIYYFQAKTLTAESRQDMARIAERLFNMVNIFLYERTADIKLFASSLSLTSGNYSQSDMTKRFLEYRDVYNCYDSLAVFDLKRKCIIDTTCLNIGKEDPLDRYWLDPRIGKDLVINASYSSTLNMPILYFTYPVKNSKGKVFRIAVSRIPMSKIGEISKIRTKYFFERDLELDLIDKNGILLYSTHNLKGILKEKAHHWSAIESRIKSQAQPASFFLEGEGKVLVFVLPQPGYLDLQGQGWYLVLHIPLKKALVPVVSLRNKLIIITAIFGFLTCVVAYILSRRISRPINKLSLASKHFAEGDMDYRVSIKSGDEIADCASSFNMMADEIKRKGAEILQAKAYVDGIISSMVDTLIVVNPDGTLRSINKATLDLLGYTEEELIGKDVSLIFAEEEEERLFKGKRLRILIEEGSVRNFEMSYCTKSGEKVAVSFSGSVMYEAETVIATPNEVRGKQSQEIASSPSAPRNDMNRRVIGVVGVAHDMRQIKALMADLEGTKAAVEEYAKGLEKKVEERTKDLTESQEATLSIMEDIQESKEELEKTNIELKRAKEEIESFSKGLEEKIKERTAELSILYEVSNAISYTLDYQTLLKLIMESLFRIVEYDVCASLLFYANTVNVTLKPTYPGSARFVDDIKNSLLDSTSVLTGEAVRKKRISVFLIPSDPNAKPKENRQFDELRSFFNVPFVVRGKTIGMINVSSCRDNAFSEDDIRLIYTIANQASNAIERLQAVITAEKSKMESMVESMVEGVVMIDERGEIVVLNPQGRRMLGFNLTEELTSNRLTEKMKVIDLYDAFQECQNEQKSITKEITVPQGEESVFLRCEIAPVKETKGHVIGMVTILRDITMEKEVDAMKSEFITTVSHELRTPLTSIKSAVDLVLTRKAGEINENQEKFLSMAERNIDRLSILIGDLLTLSKIEAGKMELKISSVNITNLIKNTVFEFNDLSRDKQVSVDIKFSKDEIELFVDKDKIIQVLVNLISNALKFTPVGGRVQVSCEDREEDVLISVQDSGVGVDKENIPKLFTKFTQFGREIGPGLKGTGLGLSICKGIVETHKGRIWAESVSDVGSTFFFTLPRLDSRKIFKPYISNEIIKARKEEKGFSMILVSIKDFKQLFQEMPETMRGIPNEIEDIVTKTLRKKDDKVTKAMGEFLIILPFATKDMAVPVLNRLKDGITVLISGKEDLKDKLELIVELFVYPEDGKDEEELFNRLKTLNH